MNELIDYRDSWADLGIHIIKPKVTGCRDAEGPMAQAELIADQMSAMCRELGARTVIWDTLTASVKQMLDELARSGIHKTSTTKEFRVVVGNDVLTQRVTPDRRDYMMSQDHLRLAVRNRMLHDPARNYHLIHILHQETAKKSAGKDKDGEPIYIPTMHGPNGGGPGSVESWGTEYQAINRVFVEGVADKAKRYVQLSQFTDASGVPYAARTNVGGNIPAKIEIPGDFAGAVKVWEAIARAMALDTERPDRTGYYSGAIYGVMGSGKTRWASAFLGLANALPCVYVAADGDSEYLRSFWNELKTKKQGAN